MTESQTARIVAFIEARLAEDERPAKKAARFRYDQPTDAPWERARILVERGAALTSDAHIARHDPARVLRGVAAKRAVLAEVRDYSPELEHGDNGEWALGMVVRNMATEWDTHQDYDEAWRP